MSIFKNWKPKEAPHTNCREVLWGVKRNIQDFHEKIIGRIGEDGADLLTLRGEYKKRIYALQNEIGSMRDAIEFIDETLMLLAAHEAWQDGYEGAEADFKPQKHHKTAKKKTADHQMNVGMGFEESEVVSA